MIVKCTECQKEIKRTHPKQENFFCSRDCFNKFYQNKKSYIITICKNCSFLKEINVLSKQLCNDCKEKRLYDRKHVIQSDGKISEKFINKRIKKYGDLNCLNCKNNILPNLGKYCKVCVKQKQIEGGLKSSAIQNLRSKNEIEFFNLCKKEFINVTNNDRIFNGWDADIILHDFKIAILWNGIWHYEQIHSKHSLSQVQARDKIKINEIKNKGFIYYIIKDIGRQNSKFVNQQFEIFKIWIKDFKK